MCQESILKAKWLLEIRYFVIPKRLLKICLSCWIAFNEALENKKTHPLELSAIFHQMFIYSHPFPDGNGRLGRLFSNFILERFKHPHVIILKEDKDTYIEALQVSEKQNSMEPIIDYFYNTSIQRMKKEIAQKKNLSKNFTLGIKQNKNRGRSI